MFTDQTPESFQKPIQKFFKEKSHFIETANDWLDELQLVYCMGNPALANGASEFVTDLKELLNALNKTIN